MLITRRETLIFFIILLLALAGRVMFSNGRFPATNAHSAATVHCPVLVLPDAPTIDVDNQADLIAQAYNAAPGTIIRIAPGIYNMSSYLHIIHDGITLRGQPGRRGDVILDFGGMVGGHFGILVDADDVTIADLTIRNAADHGVSIQGRDRPTLYNLHILDINDQLVKVNPAGDGSEDGLLACSRLEYTTTCPRQLHQRHQRPRCPPLGGARQRVGAHPHRRRHACSGHSLLEWLLGYRGGA